MSAAAVARSEQTGGAAGAPFDVLIEQGQTIPGTNAVVETIGRFVAGVDGEFALLGTAAGGSIVRLAPNGDVVPVLGVGSQGERASFDPRSYVVGAGAVVADVAVGEDKRIVAADVADPGITRTIIGTGAMIAGGTVTDVFSLDPVFVNHSGRGTGRIVVGASTDVVISFDTGTGTPSARFSELGQAPGFGAGVNILILSIGVRINQAGFTSLGMRIFGTGVSSANDEVEIVLNSDDQVVAMVREGTQVPDAASGTVFTLPAPPVLGATGAAVLHRQLRPDTSTPRAVGFVDLAGGYRTLAVAGSPAPGGGVFSEFPLVFAMNDAGVLVFRGTLEGGGLAYYAVDTTDPQSQPLRLIGTGDSVPLPEGGTATITGVGAIPTSGGQSGDPTALNTTHLVLAVSLSDQRGAVATVELPGFE
jgi:hypothetical protein